MVARSNRYVLMIVDLLLRLGLIGQTELRQVFETMLAICVVSSDLGCQK